MRRLFLDDIRVPLDCPKAHYMTYRRIDLRIYHEDWIIVRSHGQFVKWIMENGMPDLISFDHDLGMVQEWRVIEDYPNYSVSDFGLIKNNKSGYILKQSFNKSNGGLYVNIGGGKLVHRFVAKAFLSNPNNKPQINHIDGNRCNNNICNLEWVTNSENVKHSHEKLHRNFSSYGSNHKNSLSVTQYTLSGLELETFGSTNEAARQLNINFSNIAKCARGERKTAGGFVWKYEDKNITTPELITKLGEKEYYYTPVIEFLGGSKIKQLVEYTGMDSAKWLVNYCIDNDLKLPEFVVHSANPSGYENILGLLKSFKKEQTSGN